MKARIGDQIIVEGRTADESEWDGEIVGLRHTDGTPSYDVRWSDDGTVTPAYPGPDARVRHREPNPPDRGSG
ncbi:DUF1918 domain-containing protein [Streptomyces sp. NPDC058665]|uniref:DUF1918 domain-containing protein n=1 Tax=Streptomyces sp. NPDC058665 TaxID=3346586 RepID=UPI0036589E0A